jgi:hypothetical protein
VAYTPYYATWHDADSATGGGNTSTPLVAAALQHIEDGLEAAATVADAAIPKTISGVATDKVPVYNGSSWVAQKIVNAQVDAAAAIAYSKLALTGSIVNADISASAAIARSKLATGLTGPPGTELAYTEITSNVSVTATVEASATTIVTAGAFTFDGSTKALIIFYSPLVITAAVASATVTLWLFEDGSSIGALGTVKTAAGVDTRVPVTVARRMTPSAASHTYSIRATQSGGNGTVAAAAGGSGNTFPAYIRITTV